MEFVEKLREVSRVAQENREYAKNESQTRDYLIKPFLRALGYLPDNPNDVKAEYTADFVGRGSKVDYALYKGGKPIIFIEAKSATIATLTHSHTKQLQYYLATKLEARFGILTNGLEYRFYADIDNPNVMDDEPFLVVNMLKLNETQAAALSIFAKSNFTVKRAFHQARRLKFEGIIRQRVKVEFAQPGLDFVKQFAQGLYKGKFTQAKMKEFRPLVKRAWDDLVDQEIARRLRRHDEMEGGETSSQPEPDAPLPAGDVVEVPIFGTYNKQRVEATLIIKEHFHLLDKQNVRFNGAKMNHRTAMLNAKRNINPDAKDNKSAWFFWYFRHPDTNEETPIKELFQNETLRNQIRSSL